MNRVRAGLTGLGLVFLFTLMASVAFAPSPTALPGNLPGKEPGEPLAQLGVAPSSEKMSAGPSVSGSYRRSDAGESTADPASTGPVGNEQPMAAVPEAALSALERGEAPTKL